MVLLVHGQTLGNELILALELLWGSLKRGEALAMASATSQAIAQAQTTAAEKSSVQG